MLNKLIEPKLIFFVLLVVEAQDKHQSCLAFKYRIHCREERNVQNMLIQ